MLNAIARRKAALDDDNDVQDYSRLEDALTASVFERLAYLPAPVAIELLQQAIHPRRGLPDSATFKAVFWPSYTAAGGSSRVEPDVVVELDSAIMVVECKHLGEQDAGQWRREILAVRSAEQFPNRSLLFLAAGGIDVSQHSSRVATVADLEVPVLQLRWERLHEVCMSQRTRQAEPHVRAIFDDLVSALGTFGYNRAPTFEKPLPTFPEITDARIPGTWDLSWSKTR